MPSGMDPDAITFTLKRSGRTVRTLNASKSTNLLYNVGVMHSSAQKWPTNSPGIGTKAKATLLSDGLIENPI